MSIKELITNYLEEKGDWVFGGTLDDYVRSIKGSKTSNTSRRCRELCEEGKIERRLVKCDMAINMVVQYRIKKNEPIIEIPIREPIQSSLLGRELSLR